MRSFSKAHFCLDVPYIINTVVSITVLIEKKCKPRSIKSWDARMSPADCLVTPCTLKSLRRWRSKCCCKFLSSSNPGAIQKISFLVLLLVICALYQYYITSITINNIYKSLFSGYVSANVMATFNPLERLNNTP